MMSYLFKKVPLERESLHSVGGTSIFIALFQHIYIRAVLKTDVNFSSLPLVIFFSLYLLFENQGKTRMELCPRILHHILHSRVEAVTQAPLSQFAKSSPCFRRCTIQQNYNYSKKILSTQKSKSTFKL